MNGIDDVVLEHVDRRGDLVGVVAADDAAVGLRVVGLADAREQQQVHVVLGEGAEHDELGRLLELLALARRRR